jgi:hypothetical protein
MDTPEDAFQCRDIPIDRAVDQLIQVDAVGPISYLFHRLRRLPRYIR